MKILVSGLRIRELRIPRRALLSSGVAGDTAWVDHRRLKRAKRLYKARVRTIKAVRDAWERNETLYFKSIVLRGNELLHAVTMPKREYERANHIRR